MNADQDRPASIDGLAKASRRAALMSLAGAIIVIASLAYAFQHLIALERAIEEKKHELVSLKNRKQDLIKENEALEQRNALLRTALETAGGRNPSLMKQALDSAAQSYPQAARLVPRVYLHIARQNQRERAQAIQVQLRDAGLVVPGIEYVGAQSPKVSQLRYFHESDEEEKQVQALASKLETQGVKLQLIRIKGYDDIAPGSYEIWLGRES